MWRVPALIRPKAAAYGHIIAIDQEGCVIDNLQDPDGGYPMITSVFEIDDYLYIGSEVTPVLARVAKPEVAR